MRSATKIPRVLVYLALYKILQDFYDEPWGRWVPAVEETLETQAPIGDYRAYLAAHLRAVRAY